MARFTHVIDSKGRMVLPAKLRDSIGPVIYVTHSLDMGYLSIYSEEQFEIIREQLNALPGTDPLARRLRREIIGEALRLEPDANGRVSMTMELWNHIKVETGDSICLIDMGDSIQLCSERFYQAEKAEELPLSEMSLDAYEIRGIL